MENSLLTAANKYFSDTIIETYSNGKKNTHTGKLLTVDELVQTLSENLEFSDEDIETLSDTSGVSDAEACQLAGRFFNHDLIPEKLRAAYLRTVMFNPAWFDAEGRPVGPN
ncbi:hypothetical protein D3C80_1753580 [compost metagenome]